MLGVKAELSWAVKGIEGLMPERNGWAHWGTRGEGKMDSRNEHALGGAGGGYAVWIGVAHGLTGARPAPAVTASGES